MAQIGWGWITIFLSKYPPIWFPHWCYCWLYCAPDQNMEQSTQWSHVWWSHCKQPTHCQKRGCVVQCCSQEGNTLIVVTKAGNTQMGIHHIKQVKFSSDKCNCILTEHGLVLSRKTIYPYTLLGIDWHVIIDHEGNIIYSNGKKVHPPKPGLFLLPEFQNQTISWFILPNTITSNYTYHMITKNNH